MLHKPAHSQHYAYLALLGATAIWGIAGPIIKLTLQYIPAISFLFIRFLIVCIVLLPLAILEIKKHKINTKDILNLTILGLLSQTGIILVFFGFKYTTALDAALISAAQPILAVAAGHYFYKERVSKLEEVGVLIATLGTLVVILEPLLIGGNTTADSIHRFFGNVLILSYQITWLAYIIWSKKVMGKRSALVTETTKKLHIKPLKKKYNPTILTTITFYVGLASLTPLVILESFGIFGSNTFSLESLTTTPLLGIIYMALFSSIVAYFLFQWGLDKAEVADTAIFTYLGPVFAFPAAFLLLGEVPSIYLLLGACIIATGVVIAEKYKG
jgi:drug/metabolite transporter (DMT)-like permease